MSSESSLCPIDWRPSALLPGALALLGGLAACSAELSALAPGWRLVLAGLALGHGLWLARREARRPACSVQLDAQGDGVALVFPGRVQRLSARRIALRGPLARLSGRDERGRAVHLLWWPDTLPAAARRRLRLAAGETIAETGPGLATMPG